MLIRVISTLSIMNLLENANCCYFIIFFLQVGLHVDALPLDKRQWPGINSSTTYANEWIYETIFCSMNDWMHGNNRSPVANATNNKNNMKSGSGSHSCGKCWMACSRQRFAVFNKNVMQMKFCVLCNFFIKSVQLKLNNLILFWKYINTSSST